MLRPVSGYDTRKQRVPTVRRHIFAMRTGATALSTPNDRLQEDFDAAVAAVEQDTAFAPSPWDRRQLRAVEAMMEADVPQMPWDLPDA
jgi:hypothetical protein